MSGPRGILGVDVLVVVLDWTQIIADEYQLASEFFRRAAADYGRLRPRHDNSSHGQAAALVRTTPTPPDNRQV